MRDTTFILNVLNDFNHEVKLSLYYDTEEETKVAREIIENGLDSGKSVKIEKYGDGGWKEYDMDGDQ